MTSGCDAGAHVGDCITFSVELLEQIASTPQGTVRVRITQIARADDGSLILHLATDTSEGAG
jgi:hypothetical protein